MGTRNYWKSSVAMTRAHAAQAAGFKNCCMLTGEFDGSDRHDFFQRLSRPSVSVSVRVGCTDSLGQHAAHAHLSTTAEEKGVERDSPFHPN
jgi:hypothetical protein